jgi:GNAT superfamily N-acetyltransferase
MNFLIDTNILISAEPTSPDDVERVTPLVAALLGEIVRGHHGLWIHPESVREVSGDRDTSRCTTRLLLVAKYPELKHPPPMSARLIAAFGAPVPGSHNEVDLLLLSAVDADAADYFITEDERIHKRARRSGLSTRVLTVADALATIRALFPTVPAPPPHVVATVAHTLRDDPIFATLRADYAGFDAWLSKCKREQRLTWVIERDGRYVGVCLIKDEPPPVPDAFGKAAKICTFKVSDDFRGFRYGELLLKTVFAYFTRNDYGATFVDVLPKHEHLIDLFDDFGFQPVLTKSTTELVMLKRFQPGPNEATLGPLAFNVAYGPHAIRLSGAQIFVIPIQPRFNQLLFPESEQQLQFKT